MSQVRQLANANGESQSVSNCADDDSTRVSAPIKAELELIVIKAVEGLIVPIVEKMFRSVVKQEIELALDRFLAEMNQNFANERQQPEPRSLQLRFLNKLSLPILTGMPIKGEDSTSVKVALVDACTGEVVKFGPEASAKVEIMVLQVDPGGDEIHVTGNTFLNLKKGIGSVDEISFAHSKKWMKKRKLMLGAKIVDDFDGPKVREAKSEPFILEDRRNNMYKKHYPPSLSDEVWRLRNIGKGGPLEKRLSDNNIKTVKDFLIQFFINREGLQEIIGTKNCDEMLNITVKHGLTCKLNERFVYHPCGSNGVVFNAVGQVVGVDFECRYVPIDNLSETQRSEAQKLVISAFEHWGEVVPYDENSLLHPSSHLVNTDSPSNSPKPENPRGSTVGPSHLIDRYDHTRPNTPFPVIISSNNMGVGTSSVGIISSSNPVGATSSMDSFDSLSIDPMVIPDEPVEGLSQVPDNHMFDPDFTTEDLEICELEWLPNSNFNLPADMNVNLLATNLGAELPANERGGLANSNFNLWATKSSAELPANEQSAENEFLLVDAWAIPTDRTQNRKWPKVSIVLRFAAIFLNQ